METARQMKIELLDILACPVCKSPLTLTVEQEDATTKEVLTGFLLCQKCNERYPIEDSIPNLLPPDLRY